MWTTGEDMLTAWSRGDNLFWQDVLTDPPCLDIITPSHVTSWPTPNPIQAESSWYILRCLEWGELEDVAYKPLLKHEICQQQYGEYQPPSLGYFCSISTASTRLFIAPQTVSDSKGQGSELLSLKHLFRFRIRIFKQDHDTAERWMSFPLSTKFKK